MIADDRKEIPIDLIRCQRCGKDLTKSTKTKRIFDGHQFVIICEAEKCGWDRVLV